MTIETIKVPACETCADIILQGYSDSIDCNIKHLEQVRQVESLLTNANQYFSGSAEAVSDDWTTRCACCNVIGVSHICEILENKQ